MSILDGDLTTIAFCWRLERRDGVTIGLTDHDRDLAVDGLVHRAAPGMTPSAVQRSDGLDAAGMDAAGALTSAAIDEADLLAGRWDGARVSMLAIDWTGAEGRVDLGSGTIGQVEMKDGAFTAALRGSAAALAGAVVETTSPTCRAELGDRRCRVALAPRTAIARVVAWDGAGVTLDRAEPSANGWGGGLLRWLSGANSGLESYVGSSAGSVASLRMQPPFLPGAGDLVEVREGCDKNLATCRARFANAANFQGEPYLPGMDLLTRYPGA